MRKNLDKNMDGIVLGPVTKLRCSRKSDDGGPGGSNQGGAPSTRELRWCTWGFLMAARLFADPNLEPPTMEYVEALAELRGLKVPEMREYREEGEEFDV